MEDLRIVPAGAPVIARQAGRAVLSTATLILNWFATALIDGKISI